MYPDYGYCKDQGYIRIVAFELNSARNAALGEPEPLPADSFLISCFRGSETFHILLDAGKRNQGRRIIVPYLHNAGIRTLDMAIISHPHQDHFGGLIDLLEDSTVEIKQIVYAPVTEEDVRRGDPDRQNADNWKRLETLLASRRQSCRELSRAEIGQELRIGPELSFKIIDVPLARQPADAKLNLNDLNLVLKLSFRQFTALFPGDCAVKQSGDIMQSPLAGEIADVFLLKAAHHGGNQSLTPELIEACNARVVLIPSNDLIAGKAVLKENCFLYGQNGANVLRTDVFGAIELTTDGYRVTCKTEYPGRGEPVVFDWGVC